MLEIFRASLGSAEVENILSGAAIGSSFVISDLTSFCRNSADLTCYFPTYFSFLSHKGWETVYGLSGLATGMDVVLGALKIPDDMQSIARGDAIGDERGGLMGRAALIKDVTFIGAGISYIVYRIFSIVDLVKNIQVGSLIGRVNTGFLQLGLSCYAAFFALWSVIFGIRFYENGKFAWKLSQKEGLADQVELLQKKYAPHLERIHEKLLKKCGGDEVKLNALLRTEALTAGKEGLRQVVRSLGISCSDKELGELLLRLMHKGKTEKQLTQELNGIALGMRVQKARKRKDKKLERALGKAGLDTVKELAQDKTLLQRVKAGDACAEKTAQGLVEKIRAVNRSKLTENGIVLAICLMGIAAMVAATVCGGGIPLIVSGVLMLVFGILVTGVDSYYLYQSYKEEKPLASDRKVLILSSLVGIGSFAAALALALSGVVTMGAGPLIVAGVMLAIWLGQNGLTWAVLARNERLHEEKHPTVKTLLKALENAETWERIEKMLDNLLESEKLREALKDHVEEGGKRECLKAELLTRVERVKRQKLERKERLSGVLSPYLVRERVSEVR